MNNNVRTIENAAKYARSRINAQRSSGISFAEVLKTKSPEVSFSAHAQARLKSRNIDMTPEMMQKLGKAISGAQNKGSQDSLILLSDLAFIVNVPNRTVVTAMDGECVKDNVFTNIDSAVIAG
ncbi:MAG: TIGR02530 family flagellar biosynthesis protein [Chitinispirillaceae bacterium]